ncbi:hypothetical protein PZE05_02600, partial [Limosilactobacillus mucosae]|uniref:hypothetical protein n=1 Tax=Limosilactobacillus mucosae TaxID=97478 RepID=UPI0023AF3FB8
FRPKACRTCLGTVTWFLAVIFEITDAITVNSLLFPYFFSSYSSITLTTRKGTERKKLLSVPYFDFVLL